MTAASTSVSRTVTHYSMPDTEQNMTQAEKQHAVSLVSSSSSSETSTPSPQRADASSTSLAQRTGQVFISLARELSKDLRPGQLSEVFALLKQMEGDLEALKDNARKRLLSVVVSAGTASGESGTMTAEVDGWTLEARRSGGIYDDRRVEQLLRNKGINPTGNMMMVVSYKTIPEALDALVGIEKLTQAEVDACKKPITYALQAPRKTAPNEVDD